MEYDGAAFHGWQRQPELRTVQGELERAFQVLLKRSVPVTGQGRTDAGVHAEYQVAHVQVAPEEVALQELTRRLNGLIGPDAAVRELRFMPAGFHARFTARERAYRYQVVRRFSPLRRRTHWWVAGPLDLERMRELAALCLGSHDFSGFCRPGPPGRSTRCRIRAFSLEPVEEGLTFRLSADRFLHHMVRRLVGELVRAGRDERRIDRFVARLRHPVTGDQGATAPAHGLFLEGVRYPPPWDG